MNRAAHNRITRALCPDVPLKVIDAVNAALDAPSREYGPSHRRFNHDPISASIIGAKVALELGCSAGLGVKAANAHLLEDRFSDGMTKVVLASIGNKRVTMKHVWDIVTG